MGSRIDARQAPAPVAARGLELLHECKGKAEWESLPECTVVMQDWRKLLGGKRTG
jgi:hypothetical protein